MRARASRIASIVSKLACFSGTIRRPLYRRSRCPELIPGRKLRAAHCVADASSRGRHRKKCLRMKLERGRKVLCKIDPVVASRIEVELVRNLFSEEEFVEGLRTSVEAHLTLGAAVEIDFHAFGTRAIFDQRERIVAIPIGAVERRAE